MQVRFDLECLPNELRRLTGGADVSPLAGLWHALLERTLIEACRRQGRPFDEASAGREPAPEREPRH